MKDDYSYWSENLHSAYLFYTLEVDKLSKENKRLREALEYAVRFYKECIDTKSEPDITEWVEIFAQALGE